jgi:hypothetical protein
MFLKIDIVKAVTGTGQGVHETGHRKIDKIISYLKTLKK